jgi:hypothetical protein
VGNPFGHAHENSVLFHYLGIQINACELRPLREQPNRIMQQGLRSFISLKYATDENSTGLIHNVANKADAG